MMFAIFGALGRQGPAILRYLMSCTDAAVVTVDHPLALVPGSFAAASWLDRNRWTHTTMSRACGLLEGKNATVISCLDPSRNAELARKCVRKGWNYMDLGGDTAVSREIASLDAEAKTKNVVLASECGIAPGIISSIAAELARHPFGSPVYSVRIFCGGIPRTPQLPFGYARSFSSAGLVREYSGTAEYRRNGKVIYVPSLSEVETVYVPGLGVLEAFATSGGLGTAPEDISLSRLEYKTLRYPGHLSMLKQDIMWRPDAAQVIDSLCPEVSAKNPDLIVLVVETTQGHATEVSTYFWEFDFEGDLSAMAQATGYSVAALAAMIGDDVMNPGFLPMHAVPWHSWQERLLRIPGQMLPVLND